MKNNHFVVYSRNILHGLRGNYSLNFLLNAWYILCSFFYRTILFLGQMNSTVHIIRNILFFTFKVQLFFAASLQREWRSVTEKVHNDRKMESDIRMRFGYKTTSCNYFTPLYEWWIALQYLTWWMTQGTVCCHKCGMCGMLVLHFEKKNVLDSFCVWKKKFQMLLFVQGSRWHLLW